VSTETIPFPVRPYASEADLALLAEIMNICDAHDQLEESVTVAELREEYSDPRFNASQDLLIWFLPDGSPAAFAEYHAPLGTAEELHDAGYFVYFKIVPAARGIGIEAAMLEEGDRRRRAVEQALGIPIRLEAVSRDVETERSAILESLGFTPFRYFLRMARPITGELADPIFPAGFVVRAGDLSDSDYVELRNAVWIDHFGYQPWQLEEVRHYRELSNYNPALDLIAYDPTGRPAALCWGSIQPDENMRTGRNDGWIGMLGVRREYRNLGLGRAMLREGMRALRAVGMDYARLGVDGSSPTGANKLYVAEGFETKYSRILYSRA
jgi:mycothiol synthase